jgi:hypothetical protein
MRHWLNCKDCMPKKKKKKKKEKKKKKKNNNNNNRQNDHAENVGNSRHA